MVRYSYKIRGVVQGVGFRPFVYQLSLKYALSGFVKNTSEGVTIEVQGESLEAFEKELQASLPPLAKIDGIEKEEIPLKEESDFQILESGGEIFKTALVSPDIKVCEECLEDLKSKEKYQNYFAVNCTNCGPRYSILQTVPYDRKNTSMAKFEMCESCKKEYEDPTNRRYHAQPISCNSCGPEISLIIGAEEYKENIYQKAAELIKQGKILAVKGIGGFHIVCDATNDDVIQRLREAKNRPTKPFALMCRDLKQIEQIAKVSDEEKELLESKEAPIVILKKDKNSLGISEKVAPNIDRVGCFLPYTPLHFLLFEHLENPIVATSGNLGEEPIITTKDEILEKLPFVDAIIDFDRDIVNGVDDSLVLVVNGDVQILRLARGYAPKVLKLPKKTDKKILAVGGNQKSTISFCIDDMAILSPHIGDLGSLKAFGFFERTVETFQRFYDFKPGVIVCDKHPNYETTKWAKQQNIEIFDVQHHLAHIYSVKAEYGLTGDYLGFSFDGTGYGEDGTLWGGEIFVGNRREYHFKPIKFLGGEKAIREPRRVALSMLFDRYSLDEILKLELETVKSFSESEMKLLYQSYIKDLNSVKSSSVGRLFDGVASLANLCQFQSYEGEAGLLCENSYDSSVENTFPYEIKEGEIIIEFDFFSQDLVSVFINTLAKIVVDIALRKKKEVILSGGVFQNRTLLEKISKDLKKENINFHYNKTTPINDGGVSLGQLYYFLETDEIIAKETEVLKEFLDLVENGKYFQAHEQLEHYWKEVKKISKERSLPFRGLINGATAFALYELGRESYKSVWQAYLKYCKDVTLENKDSNALFVQCKELMEKRYILFTQKNPEKIRSN